MNMGKDSADKGSGMSKEDSILALKVILKKIKSGEATPDQIAFAMDINQALGGGFSGEIASAIREAEAKEANKSGVAAPTEEKTDPVAKADKFFGSEEMRQVLGVHERIANGEHVSDKDWIKSKKTVLEKAPENTKILEELEAEREHRLRAIEAKPETLHQHKDRLDSLSNRIIDAKGVELDRKITQRVMDETGKDVLDLVDHRGVMDEKFRKEMEAIKLEQKSMVDDRLSKATGQDINPPTREAESKVAGTGKKRGASAMDADEPHESVKEKMQKTSPVQKGNPGESLTPDPTPDGKGASKGKGTGMGV